MTDAKLPERIWADDEEGGSWEYEYVHDLQVEYVRKDLHDAIAKERDELRAEVERLREALHVFASAADGRRRKDWFGGMCFQQDVLLEARAALDATDNT